MQEEVTQRTVALCVEATRLSAGMLQQAMKKVLDEMQKGVTGHKTKLHHGKQTLRQLIKDMSRMGRDYLKVGQIMEILRQRGVRLIAINDGVDSARGDDDFTPFRNIMNEYYARDTSRKIRSTFQSKGKSGKHLTGTVIYGYLWNEARDQWLVDPEAADVVKRIFAMTIEGYGPYQIASKLKEEKILIPSAYLAQHGEGVNKNKTFKDVYAVTFYAY